MGGFDTEIFRQENRGPSVARNRGWHAAGERGIKFLDADDLIHPRKIEIQIIEGSGGAVDVIYSDWQRLRWTGDTWEKEKYIYKPVIRRPGRFAPKREFHWSWESANRFKRATSAGRFEDPMVDRGCRVIHKDRGRKRGIRQSGVGGPLFWYRDRPQSLSKSDPRQFVEAYSEMQGLCCSISNRATNVAKSVEAVVDVYSQAARYFAENDWKRFEQILTEIEALRPGFVPKAPLALRRLSRVVGYKNAERMAFSIGG